MFQNTFPDKEDHNNSVFYKKNTMSIDRVMLSVIEPIENISPYFESKCGVLMR